MEDVEIHVWFEFFDQLNREFPLIVSEWTEFSIVAFFVPIKVSWTELGFIFVGVIEFFNSIVCFVASLLITTTLRSINIVTFFWLVKS